MYQKLFKRIFDILISLILLLLISPLFILIIAITFITNKGKVWFIQLRIGKMGIPFYIYKFRTLTEIEAGDRKNTIVFDSLTSKNFKISRWGEFMRSLSIDELPQLINVLKNDLSLVGPRPLLPEYMDYFHQNELDRHLVKPGITGLAQVNGGNMLTWNERLSYDIEYTKNLSFKLDITILQKTFSGLFKARSTLPSISLAEERKHKKMTGGLL